MTKHDTDSLSQDDYNAGGGDVRDQAGDQAQAKPNDHGADSGTHAVPGASAPDGTHAAPDGTHAAPDDAADADPQAASQDRWRRQIKIFGRSMTMMDIARFVGFIAFFAIMIVIVIIVWPYVYRIFQPSGYEEVANDVTSAGPLGVILLLVLQFVQIVVALIPGEVMQVVAGMIYGPWIGALIILIGCVLSSAFIFVVVRKLGAPFVQSMVSEKNMRRFHSFEETGRLNIIVFGLFLIPGLPKDVFTYFVPLTHMPMRTFLVLTNVARIPGIVISTYAAAGIMRGEIWDSVILFAVFAAIAIVALFAYSRIMRHFEKNPLSGTDEDLEGEAKAGGARERAHEEEGDSEREAEGETGAEDKRERGGEPRGDE